VSGFSAEWLALRERADAVARSRSLTLTAAGALAARGQVRAIDLATGTGSNVRYLAGYLPVDQEWLLVDEDEQLLQALPARLPGLRFDARRLDLSNLERASIVDGRALVTASALLDLVSGTWLASLADLCARADAVVLFALTYDGRVLLTPEEPDDALVVDLQNRHQRTDKGFGPALGPDAAACAEEQFTKCGYRVTRERSDWVLSEGEGELQKQLIEGWAVAAIEMDVAQTARIERWRTRRLAHIAAGRSALIVGHEDLLGVRG
jgi:hypothetical protein